MRAPLLFLAAMLAAAALFTLLPGIDLWASGLFWSPRGGFSVGDWPPFRLAYRLLPVLTWAIGLSLLALLAIAVITERRGRLFDRRALAYLLITFILGPGLLANTVLKDHWGRARPSQVVEFGGTKSFTPALIPADQCDHNCSFVSGHGAMAFSLVAFALLPASPRRRKPLLIGTLAFGAFVGLARIAQGGHFLSDTVFAGFLMVAVAWLLHRWIVVADGLSSPWVVRGAAWAGRAAARGAGALSRSKLVSRHPWLLFNLACALGIVLSIAWVDRPLARHFKVEDDRLIAWFTAITRLGLGEVWLVPSGLAALGLLLAARSARFAVHRERLTAYALVPLWIFAGVGFPGLIADLIKPFIGRTRPKLLFSDDLFTWGGPVFRADHWSFPSGHTTTAAALATALYYLWPRHAVAYGMFVALIALSRIATTQHYLSDTIGGIWIGILGVAYLHGVWTRSGLSLSDATVGVMVPPPVVSWRKRLIPAFRRSP